MRERLRWEKELLGLYLSEHPMGEVAEQVGDFVTAYSGDLRSDETLDGQRLVVGGIVVGSRTVITRTRSTMAVVTLEDLQGSIEVVVFPRLYEQTRPDLAGGRDPAGRRPGRPSRRGGLAARGHRPALGGGGREGAGGVRARGRGGGPGRVAAAPAARAGGSRRSAVARFRHPAVPAPPAVPVGRSRLRPAGVGRERMAPGTVTLRTAMRRTATARRGSRIHGSAGPAGGPTSSTSRRSGAGSCRRKVHGSGPAAPVSTLPRDRAGRACLDLRRAARAPRSWRTTTSSPPCRTRPAHASPRRRRAETAPLEAVVPGSRRPRPVRCSAGVRVVEACKVITQLVRERPGETEVVVHVPAPGGTPAADVAAEARRLRHPTCSPRFAGAWARVGSMSGLGRAHEGVVRAGVFRELPSSG